MRSARCGSCRWRMTASASTAHGAGAEFLALAIRNGRKSIGAPGPGALAAGEAADFVTLDIGQLDRDAIMPVDPIDMLFARGNMAASAMSLSTATPSAATASQPASTWRPWRPSCAGSIARACRATGDCKPPGRRSPPPPPHGSSPVAADRRWALEPLDKPLPGRPNRAWPAGRAAGIASSASSITTKETTW